MIKFLIFCEIKIKLDAGFGYDSYTDAEIVEADKIFDAHIDAMKIIRERLPRGAIINNITVKRLR
jgi:hypothetical protein